MAKERLASLISAGGTTMQEIVRACQSGEILIDVACVIASNEDAGGIEKARQLQIDVVVVNPGQFRGSDGKIDQYSFGLAILKETRKRGVTIVTQNGWMPKTPDVVIEEYKDNIYNQHPGPKEPTRATKGIQPAAIMLYIVQHTGRNLGTEVIAHRVNSRSDNGTTVGVIKVPIEDSQEEPKVLQVRALPSEHRLQITLLQQVSRGEVKEITEMTQYTTVDESGIVADARIYAREQYPNG